MEENKKSFQHENNDYLKESYWDQVEEIDHGDLEDPKTETDKTKNNIFIIKHNKENFEDQYINNFRNQQADKGVKHRLLKSDFKR